jgi:hypothetical protein
VDYLATRADSDPARIGLIGISKGGHRNLSRLGGRSRIAVAVPVISAQSFRWALDHDALAMAHRHHLARGRDRGAAMQG